MVRLNDYTSEDCDCRRRRELRTFLLARRATLSPRDVGLPETGRRRVAGLRRDEVAELADVSVDWYRWLESGRPVRVSLQIIARLARALRLAPIDELKLFRLASRELYDVAMRARMSEQAFLPAAS